MGDLTESLRNPRVWARDIAVTAVLSLVAALLGPFGSFDMPFAQRLVQDLTYGFVNFALLWQPLRILLKLGDRYGLPVLFTLVAGIAVLTVAVTAVCLLLDQVFGFPGREAGPLVVYGLILTMTLPFGVTYMLLERRMSRPPGEAQARPEPPPSAPPALAQRLPPNLGGEILALKAEDHYVRVYTDRGSTLLLIRLSDAIAELAGVEGERTHRSWWVAKKAVREVRRQGRRLTLALENGLEAPVTREAAPALRKAGWV